MQAELQKLELLSAQAGRLTGPKEGVEAPKEEPLAFRFRGWGFGLWGFGYFQRISGLTGYFLGGFSGVSWVFKALELFRLLELVGLRCPFLGLLDTRALIRELRL